MANIDNNIVLTNNSNGMTHNTMNELESLYSKEGETPTLFSKEYAIVSLVQKGIHGFLFLEIAEESKDGSGLQRFLYKCEFTPMKRGRGLPKTFQVGEVKIKEIIENDETLRKEYANRDHIVLKCWKIAKNPLAEKLIENITAHMDTQPEINLTTSQQECLSALDDQSEPTSSSNTKRNGFFAKLLSRGGKSKAPIYSVTGNSSESSISSEHGIHNCFTYACYMLSTIDISVDSKTKTIYLRNCAIYKAGLSN